MFLFCNCNCYTVHTYVCIICLENDDYESGPYNVTFFAGTTAASFNVSIINDDVLENDETFHLTIRPPSAPDNVIVGEPVQATVTVADFDGKSTVL